MERLWNGTYESLIGESNYMYQCRTNNRILDSFSSVFCLFLLRHRDKHDCVDVRAGILWFGILHFVLSNMVCCAIAYTVDRGWTIGWQTLCVPASARIWWYNKYTYQNNVVGALVVKPWPTFYGKICATPKWSTFNCFLAMDVRLIALKRVPISLGCSATHKINRVYDMSKCFYSILIKKNSIFSRLQWIFIYTIHHWPKAMNQQIKKRIQFNI